MGKRVAGDSCNMVADGDRSEMRALGEDHAADGDDAVGDGDGCECATLVEGLIADVGNAALGTVVAGRMAVSKKVQCSDGL